MKISRQERQKAAGAAKGHSKSLKKSKGVKKPPQKVSRSVKPAPRKPPVEEEEEETPPVDPIPVNTKKRVKTPQVEKRKQEGNEWKGLKKTDYQRLETVVEEVQFGEATSSKYNQEGGRSENDKMVWEGVHGRVRKPWFYHLVSITEHPEVLNVDEVQAEVEQQAREKQHKQQQERTARETGKSGSKIETEVDGGPAESRSKELTGKFPQANRSLILNGILEILPIFSNDKFVCSRDALSIEECEELESVPTAGKLFDGKTGRMADVVSAEKKASKDRATDKLAALKESIDEKFHSIGIKDRSIVPQSPFMNFLLVLTPFADERERFLESADVIGKCEQKMPEIDYGGVMSSRGSVLSQAARERSESVTLIHIVFGLFITTFVLLSAFLGVAWRSYQAPCVLDYVLLCIPFIHHRRTHMQLFFDRLIQIIARVLRSVKV